MENPPASVNPVLRLRTETQTDQAVASEIIENSSTTDLTVTIEISSKQAVSPAELAQLLGADLADSVTELQADDIESSTTSVSDEADSATAGTDGAVTATAIQDDDDDGVTDNTPSSVNTSTTESTQDGDSATEITVDAEFTDDDVPSFQQNSGTAALLRAVFNIDGEWVTVKDVRSAVPDDADIDKSQISKRLWGFANDDLLEKRAGETFNEYCLTPIAKVALNEYEVEHGDDSYRHVGVDLR